MSITIPRESVEFVPITVTVNGTPVAVGVEVAIAGYGSRPSSWAAATSLSGQIGILVSGLSAGTYRIWARVTSAPETPVVECGLITIT